MGGKSKLLDVEGGRERGKHKNNAKNRKEMRWTPRGGKESEKRQRNGKTEKVK